jgi:hypothetical protein
MVRLGHFDSERVAKVEVQPEVEVLEAGLQQCCLLCWPVLSVLFAPFDAVKPNCWVEVDAASLATEEEPVVKSCMILM